MVAGFQEFHFEFSTLTWFQAAFVSAMDGQQRKTILKYSLIQ